MNAIFKFLGIDDTGPESGAKCPHCGSDGRYIYKWEINGVKHAAMAGCYQLLTGHIKKEDNQEYFRLLAEKQAKNKPLNGWDRNIIRLLNFKRSEKYPESWCNEKIRTILSERKMFLAKKRY